MWGEKMVNVVRQPIDLEVKCKHCKAVLSYTVVEAMKWDRYDYTGKDGHEHYIVCPCCHKDVIVSIH